MSELILPLWNALALLGFVAWGVVLFLITGLLAVNFRSGNRMKEGKEWLNPN